MEDTNRPDVVTVELRTPDPLVYLVQSMALTRVKMRHGPHMMVQVSIKEGKFGCSNSVGRDRESGHTLVELGE